VRGLLGYHGASTGRYISQGVQVQNFPRDVVRDWDAVREALEMDTAAIDAIYGPPLELVSKMLRGSIVPDPGHDIMAVDYSQVEARGVAWLAGADELVRAFQTKQPIYEMMASRVYDCPVAEISKDSAERHLGKTLVLGAGYQMGWWKFRETVLSTTGILITMDLAMHAISTYREAVPEIPRLWYDLEAAALTATRNEGRVVNAAGGKIAFRRDRAWLRMRLPSGRYLWYRMPRIEVDAKYEREKLVYWAVNNKTRKWEETSTFGGRLTENAVQGLCRDLLVNGALALERAGYNPITMVHDENVLMPRAGFGSVEEAIEIMCRLPQWAKGFPLAAEGKRGPRYTK
jgi:DNA polymerase